MDKIIEITFSGFWAFIGMLLLVYTIIHYIANGIIRMWARFMRMLMVRKHGWPPEHLDADGDYTFKMNN